MANKVNVDFITKVVEIEVNDNEKESLAAAAAINAAKRAVEAEDIATNGLASKVIHNSVFKVNKPLTVLGAADDGEDGQILRTKGDGNTEWVTPGVPSDEQVAEVMTEWLDEHPEATTTVEDGSLTRAKFASALDLGTAVVHQTEQQMIADTSLKVGYTVMTKGYWSVGDGGAGVYNIRAKTSADVHTITVGGTDVDVVGDDGSVIAIGDKYDVDNVLYVAECIDLNIPRTFDTVADLKNASLFVGLKVSTKGYHTVNDGGSAFYYIREKTQSDVDDGGSIIFLDNGKVAELITDRTVNVKQFGAYGDGNSDNPHDDTTAIQNAVDFAVSVGAKIFIPAGVFNISAPIDLSAGTIPIVEGVSIGSVSSILSATTAMSAMLVLGSNDPDGTHTARYISKIRLNCNNLADKGVDMLNCRRSRIIDTIVHNAVVCGIYLHSWGNIIERCLISGCAIGILGEERLNSTFIINTWMTSCLIGIRLNSKCNHVVINENCFDGCTDCGILATAGCKNLAITGNYFEHCGENFSAIPVEKSTQGQESNIVYVGGTIVLHSYVMSTSPRNNPFKNCVITKNQFIQCGSHHIVCASGIASVRFYDNDFIHQTGYDYIVKLFGLGSDYLIAINNYFEAKNQVNSVVAEPVDASDVDNNMSMNSFQAVVLNPARYPLDKEIVFDLFEMYPSGYTGTRNDAGFFDSDKLYEISANFVQTFTLTLADTSLKGKVVEVDYIQKNLTGYSHATRVRCFIDGTAVFDRRRTSGVTDFERATFYAGIYIPPNATTFAVRVESAKSDTAGCYVTSPKIKAL